MGNKIVTEADRKFTPQPPLPNGVTLPTPGRGQRVSRGPWRPHPYQEEPRQASPLSTAGRMHACCGHVLKAKALLRGLLLLRRRSQCCSAWSLRRSICTSSIRSAVSAAS